MDYRGYSTRIVEANSRASDSLGVLLGKFCISRELSATDVAEYFGVTKMTIYNWFTGQSNPSKKYEEKIQSVLTNGGWL